MNPHQAPTLLTHVCREWRMVARSIPDLWSSMIIELRFKKTVSAGPVFLDALQDWLALSRNRLLTIEYHSTIRDHTDISTSILNLICSHAHRWKDVFFDVDGHETAPALSLDSFPSLTQFQYRGNPAIQVESWLTPLRRSPNLCTLMLEWWPAYNEWSLPWPQLTSFHVDDIVEDANAAFDLNRFAANLSQSTQLKSLQLDFTEHVAIVPARERGFAPEVVDIDINVFAQPMLAEIIQALAAPKLESLTLGSEHYDPHETGDVTRALFSFLSDSGWPSALRILLVQLYGSPEVEVVEILERLPNLIELRVDGLPLTPVFLAPLTFRISDDGQLLSGTNPHVSSLLLYRYEQAQPQLEDIVALADMVESRWHVPPNAVDGNGRAVQRLDEFGMLKYDVEYVEKNFSEQYGRIERCRLEGLRWTIDPIDSISITP
ncbi:hypothetical protein EW146_g2914 [Bondarzewia mesenterica]|uniref:F-box domain-containing protein n=1 Tax=Bondarzewia mesenterica TaxID=1095465 RepID=A0A4S4M1F9_9AGAM|nr:hypothetical protein EW146_g2914 [Bondarzewia mesenterica]